ncbi:catechol 2,3-dioxygenase [Amphibacillus marinus]|uniref:Catechol 2,3-dioxygenase n=1 Tax=Amphibacillus marinus TaxID=872970 RepID=A0A1H8MA32_9BACI|nr:VOC family protein [Amphibacillus marinus]SEO14247.1 catechol 2,3-dioxygenase [Amphibacillus marinus]
MSFHKKPATYIKSLSLNVQDLTKMKEFYQTVLGFVVIKEGDRFVQLGIINEPPLLTLIQDNSYKKATIKTTGLYHFAVLLPSRSELARFLKHLIGINIQIGASDHLVSEAIYFDDPEGNGIEVYADRPPESWSWQNDLVKMSIDPLKANELLEIAQELSDWQQAPATTVLGHIHLHVSDLTAAEHFYTRGLGFEVVSRFGDQALFISTEGYHHHIGLNTWNGVGAPPAAAHDTGLRSYTIVYPDDEKQVGVIEKLHGLGYETNKDEHGIYVLSPSHIKLYLAV